MKVIVLYALIFISTVFVSCDNNSRNNQETAIQVTVMLDRTHEQRVLPEAALVLSLFEFVSNKDKSAYFRITSISDKLLNPAIEEHLPSSEETEKENQFDDPDYRNRKVLAFYKKTKQSIDSFKTNNKEDSTLMKSECFRSIAGELSRMAKRQTKQSFLLVYSDLAENSDLLNLHRDKDIRLLLNNPDSIERKLDATGLLPKDLKGVTVVFIFQPPNRKTDMVCTHIAEVYRKLITKAGGFVELSANNLKYKYS